MKEKAKNKKKVLVIGWDSADWKVIDPLIQQGKMPALKGLIERGVYGKIQTLDPPLSPMLWTSIATGFRADKHGIGGFIEPMPDGTGLRPVTTTSRKVKAIWNILHHHDYKSNVVAWWPSNPAEPINGVMVSNLFHNATKPFGEEWEVLNGSVHPKELTDELKEWRVHPGEITLSMAIPFIPNLKDNKELRDARRSNGVAKVLANASSVHAVSTNLIRTTEWDFMAVYHDALDHFSHLAMKFHPPRRPEIDEQEFEDYKHVVESGYRFHDMMLERTLELVDEDTTIVILSDHGFHSDHQRPLYIPKEPSGPAVEHSPYGIFVMAGPGIRSGGQRISGASVLDVTPTLLAHMNIPIGEDMEGKVLHAVFEGQKEVTSIPSWELVQGDFGMHDADLQEDPWEAMEAMQQLVELGYIEEIGEDKIEAVEKARRENRYYVARNLLNGKKWDEAIAILEQIFEESKITRYGQRLAFAYLSTNRLMKCRNVINELRELEKEATNLRKEEAKKRDPKDPFGNSEYEEPMYLELVEGLLNLKINRPKKALPILERIQKKNPYNFQVALQIGRIHNMRKNYKLSESQYIRALAIDDRNAYAHHGLGLSFLRRNMLEQAVDEFFAAIEENFYMPNVHYHLGEAFFRAEYFEEAEKAFQVAIRLSPGMTKAHKWLVTIYSEKLKQPEKAAEHVAFLANNIRGNVPIVTALPGSGYQDILAFLEENEVPVYSTRSEDTSKRFVSSKVRKLGRSSDWLKEQHGKLTFIPPQFLSQLPPTFNYKVIFLRRDVAETVSLGAKNQTLSVRKLNIAQKNVLKIDSWLQAQPGIDVMVLDYEEFEKKPKDLVNLVKGFIV